jgi:hypothetical protein
MVQNGTIHGPDSSVPADDCTVQVSYGKIIKQCKQVFQVHCMKASFAGFCGLTGKFNLTLKLLKPIFNSFAMVSL